MSQKSQQHDGDLSFTVRMGGGRRMVYRLRPRRLLNRLLSLLLAAVGIQAHALPTGGQVSSGQGAISQDGSSLTVRQDSQKLALNWQSFGIGSGERVTFAQPSSSAVALNRILGNDPSQIYGQLNANGQVFLLNPNGVLFGSSAQVNVGGLVASTLQLSDADFMAGKTTFSGTGGTVGNQGTIAAADGGYVALLGGQVSNDGHISARLGTVALAAGKRITLEFGGDQLLNLQLEQGVVNALAQNRQLIQADGGRVLLTARGQDALLSGVVNNSGIIEAHTVAEQGGVIRLLGSMDGDTVQVGGTLDASAPNGGNGGLIETSAARVQVAPGANITAAALAGQGNGGQWLIDPADIVLDQGLAGALQHTLNGGTSATVATAAGGGGNGDITVAAPVAWDSASRLSLNAYRDVRVNADLTGSGGGSVVLRADAQGIGTGTVAFGGGRIDLQGGSGAAGQNTVAIYYNPVSYTDAATRADLSGNPYLPYVSHGTLGAYMLVNDLAHLQQIEGNLGGAYALGKDIDASASAGANWDAASSTYLGFAPLGAAGAGFGGTLDGLGHTISGLVVNRPQATYAGLFGSNSGTLRNLGLDGGSISGQNYVGALAGANSGSIDNVSSSATVNVIVGGAVAMDSGSTLANAAASGAVNGSVIQVGGLVGTNSGSIRHAQASGAVNVSIGSVLAIAEATDGGPYGNAISSATALGAVNGSSISVGGLVGANSGSIEQSSASGDVSASIGSTSATALASVSGNDGMLAGATQSTAIAIGAIDGSFIGIGGLVGANSGRIEQASASGDVRSSIGSTNATALGAVSGNTGNTVDGSLVGSTLSNAYAAGAVRDSLVGVGGLVGFNSGLIGMSDATGAVSASIGSTNAVALGSVSAHAAAGGQVVGTTDSNATAIRALGGSALGVGGLVGFNAGTIRDAYAMGMVRGAVGATNATADGATLLTAEVGGLAFGSSRSSAEALDPASGSAGIGGLAGINTGMIVNTYATGYTTATAGANIQVGGLVGLNGGSVSDSFWDVQTTGLASSDGGSGRSTAELMQQATYPQYDAVSGRGWDFSRTWGIVDGVSYPYFRWQFGAAPQIVSGTVAGAGGGNTVQAVMNGAPLRDTGTGANGFYYFALPAGTVGNKVPLLTYVADNAALAGGHLRLSDGGHQTGMDIDPRTLTVSSRAGSVANSDLATAGGQWSGNGMPYRVVGNDVTLSGGFLFRTVNRTPFVLDGDLAASGGMRFDGTLTLEQDAALNAGGGDVAFNGAVSGAHALTIDSGGSVSQAAPITVAALELLGSHGNYQLTNAGNRVGQLAADTGTLDFVNDGSLLVGSVGQTRGVTTSGSTSLVAAGDDSDLTLEQGLHAGAANRGDTSVLLAAGRNFINHAGAGAIDAGSGRWLVYSASPDADSFGGLASGNLPLWQRTLAGNPPAAIAESGNRYLFRLQPQLTVSADNLRKTYGDALPLTASISGLVDASRYGNVFTQETISGAPMLVSAGAAASAPVTAMPYLIAVNEGSLVAPAGYGVTRYVNGTLTIDKAPLTVQADNQSRLYGDANPLLTSTISGFKNGETLDTSGVSGTAFLSTDADRASNAGTASIAVAPGSLAAGNYVFSTFQPGTLTIGKAHLTVQADNQHRLYGDANPRLTSTISGFRNGETLDTAGISGSAALFTGAGPTSVGSQVIGVGPGSLTAGNYDFEPFIPGSMTIVLNPFSYLDNGMCGWFANAAQAPGECHGSRLSGTQFALRPAPAEPELLEVRQGGLALPLQMKAAAIRLP
jgi:filamentous hemagglutinin family protein